MSLPEADEILLGEILAGSKSFAEVAEQFLREDFSRPAHREIFAAMQILAAKDEPINRHTVANELLKRNLLEECGGLTYLIELTDYGRYGRGM